MTIAKAKKVNESTQPVDQLEKERRKQVAKARNEKLLAENLAQRALIQSRNAKRFV